MVIVFQSTFTTERNPMNPLRRVFPPLLQASVEALVICVHMKPARRTITASLTSQQQSNYRGITPEILGMNGK